MFKIFISYSTHDISQVNLLKQQLQGTSIDVFVAEDSVRPSEELAARIGSAIADCDLFVLLWSENAKASEWVSQEIGQAVGLSKKILPLVLSESAELPGFIKSLKCLPVYNDPAASLQTARTTIIAEYEKKAAKVASAAREKTEKDNLALVGIGAVLLWLFSK